jgi:hypothetical protein
MMYLHCKAHVGEGKINVDDSSCGLIDHGIVA